MLLSTLLLVAAADAAHEPSIAVHLAKLRLGGSGVSWNAGPAVDFRVGPHWALGGSGLLVYNGYLGLDAGVSTCAHARRFERGFYGRFELGTAWIALNDSGGGSGRLGLGPAWRFPIGDHKYVDPIGLIDLGLELRGEVGFGGTPLEGATVGLAFEVSGGLGL